MKLCLLELPLPLTSISSPPVTEAGQSLSLTCNVSVVEHLVVSPQVIWMQPSGSIVGSGNPSTGSDPLVPGTISTHSIYFTPLQTSHGGQYTCEASITIPSLPLSLNTSATSLVLVQSKFILSKL